MEELTEQWILQVLRGQYRHQNYGATCELATKIAVHADGTFPQNLINERRPNESEQIKEYRRKIYVPITKRPVSKIISSLGKIRRSQDWMIRYNVEAASKSIPNVETLESYCEQNYPRFTSITNWVFADVIRRYLVDANALVAVLPMGVPSKTEFVKPIGVVFDSAQVLDYAPDSYAIVKSSEKKLYPSNGNIVSGDVYYIITPTYVERREASYDGANYHVAWKYEHGFGKLPCFKIGGVFYGAENNDFIFNSRIADIVPSLDEAAREYSDLQAEVVQHIHSEKIIYTNTECTECRGRGFTETTDEKGVKTRHECPRCNGAGSIASVSPYGIYKVSPAKTGESNVPMPAVQYVNKPTDMARLQDERIKQHIFDALAAVNMEFLASVPLSQSGIAKAVDRDELNNLVYAVAEDLVKVMDEVYGFINEYRYKLIVPDDEKRRAMLPRIAVPERFDLMTSANILAEITEARNAAINPVLIAEMEKNFAKKVFNEAPEVANVLQMVHSLDPMPCTSDDNKMAQLANGGVTKLDYIISCNIMAFVRRALREDKLFATKSYEEQYKVLVAYADAIETANSLAARVAARVESGELKVGELKVGELKVES
jgi:hypothetical protein